MKCSLYYDDGMYYSLSLELLDPLSSFTDTFAAFSDPLTDFWDLASDSLPDPLAEPLPDPLPPPSELQHKRTVI